MKSKFEKLPYIGIKPRTFAINHISPLAGCCCCRELPLLSGTHSVSIEDHRARTGVRLVRLNGLGGYTGGRCGHWRAHGARFGWYMLEAAGSWKPL